MNQLAATKRSQIVRCLVDGMSIRATVRITGASKNTIVKLLLELGEACTAYHDANVRGVKSQRIQVDEIWSFVGKKNKNVKPGELEPGEIGLGDVWTWTALDADSKLIVSWLVGGRDTGWATEFIMDVRERIANRVQLTADGHRAYLVAVDTAFDGAIDFGTLIKIYGETQIAPGRYSPAVCKGATRSTVCGAPDIDKISTSFVERQNLTMRMSMRRFTRLTNGFSKKLSNHEAAIALYMVHYNFVRVHQTLRVTPAMAAGITDKLWSVEDLVGLL